MNPFITEGPVSGPQAIVLYGVAGVGKSTLAAKVPEPLFWDTERGSRHLTVRRIPIDTLDALERISSIAPTQFAKEGVRTLVVDTIDGIEKLLRQKITQKFRVDSLGRIKYGHGFVYLREEFDRFVTDVLDAYLAAGIHVLVVGHSKVKRVQPPGLKEAFDRFELKLDETDSHRIKEWSDATLFFTWDLRISELGDGRPIGVSSKERQIWTAYSPAQDPKNRVNLPEKIEATWEAIRPVFCDWQLRSPQEQLVETFNCLELAQATDFLVARKWLREGQGIGNLSDYHARGILAQLIEFKAALVKHF